MSRLFLCACALVAACVTPAEEKEKAAPVEPSTTSKVGWVKAGEGAVPPLVKAELERTDSSAGPGAGRVLVYVGASWCEPCRRFHDAVHKGGLDAEFGGLRFLEFDLDRDAGRLREAGYVSKMIPLIALPLPDGRASGRQMEGSIKGDGAVMQMAPRLAALLREARPPR